MFDVPCFFSFISEIIYFDLSKKFVWKNLMTKNRNNNFKIVYYFVFLGSRRKKVLLSFLSRFLQVWIYFTKPYWFHSWGQKRMGMCTMSSSIQSSKFAGSTHKSGSWRKAGPYMFLMWKSICTPIWLEHPFARGSWGNKALSMSNLWEKLQNKTNAGKPHWGSSWGK